MKYYIMIFTIFFLFGCKDTVEKQVIKEKLLLENKKYFNSERAAKILYRESSKYFKYGTFLYPRPQSTLTYYKVLGDEPPYKRERITKKEADIINKQNYGFFEIVYTDKDNRIDAIFDPIFNILSHSFNNKGKKNLFGLQSDISSNNTLQLYATSCHFRYGKKVCDTSEDGGDNIAYGKGSH